MRPAALKLVLLRPVLSGVWAIGLAIAAEPNGLIVRVGTPTMAEVESLVMGGQRLVHVLVPDEATCGSLRSAIAAAGHAGLVSVLVWRGPGLPFAGRIANAIIVDRTAPTAVVDQAELRRVAIPGATITSDGNSQVAPPVPGLDDWRHFDHGPDGNPLSRDEIAGPATSLQWHDQTLFGKSSGVRISGRYLVNGNDRTGPHNPKKNDCVLECRDAFNGLPLWSKPYAIGTASARWTLALSDTEAYTWLPDHGDLAAIELATGRVLRRYPGTAGDAKRFRENLWSVRVADGRIYVVSGQQLQCFSVDGQRIWTSTASGANSIGITSIDLARGQIYVCEGGAFFWEAFRWPYMPNAAIRALALSDGAIRWSNTTLAVGEHADAKKAKEKKAKRNTDAPAPVTKPELPEIEEVFSQFLFEKGLERREQLLAPIKIRVEDLTRVLALPPETIIVVRGQQGLADGQPVIVADGAR